MSGEGAYRGRVRRLGLLPGVAAAAILAGCSSAGGSATQAPATVSSSAVTPSAAPSSAAPPAAAPPSTPPSSSGTTGSASTGTPSKVLVVVEENHSFTQMRTEMPFLAALSDRYGYATHWQALVHPSEPNYLAIAGGSMFGVTDDGPPSENADRVANAPSVFSQALAAGRSAATYAESMPTPCALVDAYPYAVRHNPWTYFSAERGACSMHDLSTASFAASARADRLPNVGFLIPDMLHDAHDGSLADADSWLGAQLAPVLASRDFTSGDLVVVVTADEDDRQSGNTVLTSVLTPRLSHVVVDTPLNHYSLTRFIAQVLRVDPLGQGRGAPDLATAFGL